MTLRFRSCHRTDPNPLREHHQWISMANLIGNRAQICGELAEVQGEAREKRQSTAIRQRTSKGEQAVLKPWVKITIRFIILSMGWQASSRLVQMKLFHPLKWYNSKIQPKRLLWMILFERNRFQKSYLLRGMEAGNIEDRVIYHCKFNRWIRLRINRRISRGSRPRTLDHLPYKKLNNKFRIRNRSWWTRKYYIRCRRLATSIRKGARRAKTDKWI